MSNDKRQTYRERLEALWHKAEKATTVAELARVFQTMIEINIENDKAAETILKSMYDS